MSRPRIGSGRRRWVRGSLRAAVGAAWAVSLAVPGSNAADQPPFRAIFVPPEQVSQWADDEPRAPLPLEEFRDLLKSAATRRELAIAGAPRIVAASYEARWQSGGELRGSVSLTLAAADPAPRTLPLEPWSLRRDLSGGDSPTDVPLGLWADEAGQPQFGLLVRQPGEMRWEWTAQAQQIESDRVAFRLGLPRAAAAFSLELPLPAQATMSPQCDTRMELREQARRRRITFSLPPAGWFDLVIANPSQESPLEPTWPQASLTTAYQATVVGLDVDCLIRLAPVQERAATLALRVEEPTSIRSVSCDGQPAAWRVDAKAPGRILVALPTSSRPITVRVVASSPLPWKQSYALPRILPERVRWTEGTATLWVDPLLRLESLTPTDAKLVQAVGVDDPQPSGEVFRWQEFTEHATAAVVIDRAASPPPVMTTTFISVGEREDSGSFVVEFPQGTAPGPPLAVDLAPGWKVEAVEVDPPQALAEWSVDEGDPAGRVHVTIRSGERPASLRAVLQGRRRTKPPAAHFTVRDLDWARLVDARPGQRHLVADVQGEGETTAGPGLLTAVIPARELSQYAAAAARRRRGATILDLDQSPGEAQVRFESRSARFHADGVFEVSLAESASRHLATFHCQPTWGAIREASIQFARPLPADATWTRRDEQRSEGTPLPAPSLTAHDDGTATYRVLLSPPAERPFQLQAAWSEPSTGTAQTNPAVMRAADAWYSWAVLCGRPADVVTEAGEEAPAAGFPRESRLTGLPVLGCYRLADEPGASLASQPGLRRRSAPAEAAGAQPLCTMASLHTRLLDDGQRLESIRLVVDSRGSDSLQLQLPEDAQRVEVRCRDLEASLSGEGPGRWRMDLPVDGEAATIDVRYAIRQSPLGLRAVAIPPPLPMACPVVGGRWTLSFPAGYDPSERAWPLCSGVVSRAFGPLAKSAAADDSTTSPANFIPAARARLLSGDFAPGASWIDQPFVGQLHAVVLWRVAQRQALWGACVLLAAVVTWRAGSPLPALLVGLGLEATAIGAPLEWAWMAQALALGVLATLAARLGARLYGAAQPAPGERARAASGTMILLVMATWEALSPSAASADPPASTALAPPAVLFPVDPQRRTPISEAYVPLRLFEQLWRNSDPARTGGAQVGLIAASYDLELAQDDATGAVSWVRLGGEFHFEALVDGAQLGLPLNPDDGRWSLAPADPGGNDATWSWGPRRCNFHFATRGRRRIAWELRPMSREAGRRLEASIPPLDRAPLRVQMPMSVTAFTAPDAIVAETREGSTRRWSCWLGPVDRLRANWRTTTTAPEMASSAEQLIRMNVDPAAVEGEYLLRLAGAGSIDRLELEADVDVQLKAPDSPQVQLAASSVGAPHRTLVLFDPPRTLPFTLRLPWSQSRTVSTGRIAYPRIEATHVATTNRRLVVSVADQLRYVDLFDETIEPCSSAEVEAAWRGLADGADLQYVVKGARPAWALDVRPLESGLRADQSLEITCSLDHGHVRYQARVTERPADLLSHELAIDPATFVEEVEVVVEEDGGRRPLRWARPARDKLTLFFPSTPPAPYRIVVRGRVGVDPPGQLAAPVMALAGVPAMAQRLTVRRDVGVLAEVLDADRWSPAAEQSHNDDGAILVGRGRLAAGQPGPRIAVATNQPRLDADSVTSIEPQLVGGQATYVVAGRVLGGTLDRLVLSADRTWRGPFDCGPDATASVRGSADDPQRVVVEVVPRAAIPAGAPFQFQIRGIVEAPTGRPLTVPRVELQSAATERRWIATPLVQNGQLASWARRGLRTEKLPDRLAAAAALGDSWATYRIVGPRFVAVLRGSAQRLAAPSVRVARMVAMVDADGWMAARADLTVQPGAGGEVEIELPPDAELLDAAIDGRRASTHLTGRSWRPPAGPALLPRRILLTYRQRLGADRSVAPPLVRTAADRTEAGPCFWTIALTDHETTGSVADEAGQDWDGLTAAAAKVRRAALADAAPLLGRLPAWELAQWVDGWSDDLGSLVQPPAGQLTASAPSAPAPNDFPSPRMTEAMARLTTPDATFPAPAAPRQRDALAALQSANSLAVRTRTDRALVAPRSSAPADGAVRACLAALLLVGAAALRRRRQALAAVATAPHAATLLGLAAGLFWWLLLTPPAVGAAVCCAVLLAALAQRTRASAAGD